MEKNSFKVAIFDLDGVLVDTAHYHFLAWERLAAELGFKFTIEENERLKGVSRTRSLEILLEVGNLNLPEAERHILASKKNQWYCEYLTEITENDLLPGSLQLLTWLKEKGVLIALGSASKNARTILNSLKITDYFDLIVDGNVVSEAKPNPEVFLKASEEFMLSPKTCVVFEDAYAGIEAAKAGGMYAVGIGSKSNLPNADVCFKNLEAPEIRDLF